MLQLPETKVITQQLIKHVQGKKIIAFEHEQFDKGNYSLDTISFVNSSNIADAVIIETNANYLVLDNGFVILIGYDSGGLRYYDNFSNAQNANEKRNHITGGFFVKIIFMDNSCLTLTINSWTCRFKVVKYLEWEKVDKIDPTNNDELTLEKFKQCFNVNSAVLTVCTTTNGCMDITRRAVHDALYCSQIHPKTKASKLTPEEIEVLFHALHNIVQEAVANGGLKGFIDLFGNKGKYVYTINSKIVGKPCSACGKLIVKDSGFGSTIYICPNCQVIK